MQKYKKAALCSFKGKPVYDEFSYINILSRSSKPTQYAEYLWQQAAKKMQKHFGSKFVVTLKKCGMKENGFDYFKIIKKPVERLRKVVLFVPYVKGKTKGSKNKLKEARYLNGCILNHKKEYVSLEVSHG